MEQLRSCQELVVSRDQTPLQMALRRVTDKGRSRGGGIDVQPRGQPDPLLEALMRAESMVAPRPEPNRTMRRPPRLAVYRIWLKPLEHHALACLLVIGTTKEGNPLVDCVCDCLGVGGTSTRQKKQALARAHELGLLRGERMRGTSDVDLLIAQRLIDPAVESARLALSGSSPFVFPRYRPKEYHLRSLMQALSNEGLSCRCFDGERR